MFTLMVLLAAQPIAGPVVLEPPTDREVLRAMPRVLPVGPILFELFRDDIAIVKNRAAETRVTLPLPAGASVMLTGTHWECTAYYTQTIEWKFPVPFKATRERERVVAIGKLDVNR
jgi:hypothetical protein